MTFWQLNFSVGSFFWINYACGLNREKLGDWDWRMVVLFQILVPTIVCCTLWTIPESPRWYVQKGEPERARKVLLSLRNTQEEAEQELLSIREAIEYEKEAISNNYTALFRDPSIYRKVWPNKSTINLINALNGTFGILFTLNATWTADRFGSRWLFMVGAVGMGLCMMIVPIVGMATPDLPGGTKSQSVGISIVFLLFLFAFFYKPSWGATVWIYTAEVFSMNIRAQAVGVCSQSQNVANTIFQQFFPTFLKNTGLKCLFFFMAVNFLLVAYVFFFIPETKKVPLEEIDVLFGGVNHVEKGSKMVGHGPTEQEIEDVEAEPRPQQQQQQQVSEIKGVPKRACRSPLLAYSIIALASQSLCCSKGADNSEPSTYYSHALQILIPMLDSSLEVQNEEVLAAIVILRQHEDMNDTDFGVHLSGSSKLLNSMFSLASWIVLRQDYWVALFKSQSLSIDLDSYRGSSSLVRSEPECLANRAVFLCAEACAYAFQPTAARDLDRWNTLNRELGSWLVSNPWHADPLWVEAPHRISANGSAFPTVWMTHPAHGGSVLDNFRLLLGLAISNPTVVNSAFTAAHALRACGLYFTDPKEWKESLEFLDKIHERTGWRTKDLQEQLESTVVQGHQQQRAWLSFRRPLSTMTRDGSKTLFFLHFLQHGFTRRIIFHYFSSHHSVVIMEPAIEPDAVLDGCPFVVSYFGFFWSDFWSAAYTLGPLLKHDRHSDVFGLEHYPPDIPDPNPTGVALEARRFVLDSTDGLPVKARKYRLKCVKRLRARQLWTSIKKDKRVVFVIYRTDTKLPRLIDGLIPDNQLEYCILSRVFLAHNEFEELLDTGFLAPEAEAVDSQHADIDFHVDGDDDDEEGDSTAAAVSVVPDVSKNVSPDFFYDSLETPSVKDIDSFSLATSYPEEPRTDSYVDVDEEKSDDGCCEDAVEQKTGFSGTAQVCDRHGGKKQTTFVMDTRPDTVGQIGRRQRLWKEIE
ncbi:putative quinate permease, partial [Colletotrichum shisoi]